MGTALGFENQEAFNYAIRKLGQYIGNYDRTFQEARKRVDATYRSLLELVLHASILTCNNELCQEILIYGRTNTFLLSINNNLVEKALIHFEPGGI